MSRPRTVEARDLAEQLESSLRREIAQSWRRSMLSGVPTETNLGRMDIADVDRQSRLLDAAEPVLDRLARDLDGTGYCVLLADRDARLIDMRFGQPRIESRMADDGALLGRLFSEDQTGTNSIATVFETRAPLAVRGDEHYIESLKKFTCYGVPIIHPVTRRLDGVLDLTSLTENDSPLLGAFVSHAAAEMESRLLERSRAGEHDLLRAFHATVERRGHAAVVGLSPGVFLGNPLAEHLLDPLDRTVLRAAVEESSRDMRVRLALHAGATVDADITRVSRTSAVVVLSLAQQAPTVSTWAPPASVSGRAHEVVLLRGTQGTGKSHTAREMRPGARIVSCDTIAELSTADWLAAAAGALRGTEPVIIDDIHLLPSAVAHRLGELIDSRQTDVVLTAATEVDPASGLENRASRVIGLPTFSAQPDRIVPVATCILAEVAPHLSLSTEAMRELARRPWPGNVTQLRQVILAAAAMARFGEISAAHLPAVDVAIGDLDPLQRAERDTIAGVLNAHGHNKSKAADELRISRTTLYKRMRELGIPG